MWGCLLSALDNSACHAMQKLVIRAEDLRLQDIVSSHFVGIPCADGE